MQCIRTGRGDSYILFSLPGGASKERLSMNPLPKQILDYLIADAKKWKRNVVVLVIAFALSFVYYSTKEPLPELYNGGDFTMVVPAGSTPVKVENSTEPVGEQQMVHHYYFFQNGGVSYG